VWALAWGAIPVQHRIERYAAAATRTRDWRVGLEKTRAGVLDVKRPLNSDFVVVLPHTSTFVWMWAGTAALSCPFS